MSEFEGMCGSCEFYGNQIDKLTRLVENGCPWPRSPEKKWCPPYHQLMEARQALADEIRRSIKTTKERDAALAQIKTLEEWAANCELAKALVACGWADTCAFAAGIRLAKEQGLEKTKGNLEDPGLRDPDHPCDEYNPGLPGLGADCDGDGHYLCLRCDKMPKGKREDWRAGRGVTNA